MRAMSTTTTTTTLATATVRASRRRPTTRRPTRAYAPRARSSDDDDDATANESSTSATEPKPDPFRFGARRQAAPAEIRPGFDTAEGGKVGRVGTVVSAARVIGLFGGSFFCTSVPRGSVEELAARQLADDPNAPTQSFARR